MNAEPQQDLKFSFYNDPLIFFNIMLDDIKNAKKSIYLQTYKFSQDPMGTRFRDLLTRKAQEGVKVCVLIDSWGSGVSEKFFAKMIAHGGLVKFFKKLRIRLDIFSANHMRNHRKLLIIDEHITFIGSANITGYSLNWRESVLRISGNIAKKFKSIFFEDFNLSKKYFPNKKKITRKVKYAGFEIIKDVPSTVIQPTRKRMLELIKKAKEEIIIETPYFLPDSTVRKALTNAAERTVKVTVITPLHSDVGLFDILRNKYLGPLHKSNIRILQYKPHNLHAKIMCIDKKTFCIGSSNFDYRSFRFQHEINLVGDEASVASMLQKHIDDTSKDCLPFDYQKWLRRPRTLKAIEFLLVPIRHLF